jgi:hypothetical protein
MQGAGGNGAEAENVVLPLLSLRRPAPTTPVAVELCFTELAHNPVMCQRQSSSRTGRAATVLPPRLAGHTALTATNFRCHDCSFPQKPIDN